MSKPKLKRKLIIQAGQPATIEAAKEEGGLPTFEMLAYTGGKMNVGGWSIPVVVDISGVNLGRKNQPILKDHNTSSIVGHAVEVNKTESEITVTGICSGAGAAQAEVVASSSNGFPWQSSVGIDVHRVVELEEGKTANVNGQEFEGPLYIARKSKLNEVSFVALGADENTSAKVAAEAADDLEISIEENNMKDAEEKKALEAEKAEKARAEKEKIEAQKLENAGTESAVKAMRDEQVRINKINAECKDFPEVAEKAIAEGLSVEATKAAILDVMKSRKASDIGASYINTGAGQAEMGTDVLTAAACMSTGAIRSGKMEDHFEEKTLDAAHKMRHLGLKGLMEAASRSEGKFVSASMSDTNELIQAAFSTMTLPNMLSGLATKALMDSFTAQESKAALLAEKLTASTFHEYTGVKLGGMGLMEKVQNGGQIKSGTQSEETFTYNVSTVGKLIGITREMLTNDDLGGFTRTAANLGRSAYNTRENDFWALVLANTGDFFGEDNSNYLTDALDVDGIQAAEKLLLEQVGIDGTPINVMAKYLVVPPALANTARGLFFSPNFEGATAQKPALNTYQGDYEPVITPYLSNSNVNANASDTGWYLMSDMMKPFGIAYLNGNENQVVQEATLPAGYLGRCWIGYYDYGVCQVEERGGVFSAGDDS